MNKDIKIKVCMGTGGIAAGGTEVIEAFNTELKSAEVTASVEKSCSMHKVGCRGLCAKDVLVDIIIDDNKTTYQHIKPHMVQRIVKEHLINGSPVAEWVAGEDYYNFHKKQTKVVLSDCGNIDPEDIDAYIGTGGYKAVEAAITNLASNIIENLLDKPWRGYILGYEEGHLIISGGKSQNIKPLDTFDVVLEGKRVKNPQTNMVIELPGQLVGKIKVHTLSGDNPNNEISLCSVSSGDVPVNNFSDFYIQEIPVQKPLKIFS